MQNAEEKRISVIPANPQYDRSIRAAEKKLRVAAYCRVSTELIQQESSYTAQVEYYKDKIEIVKCQDVWHTIINRKGVLYNDGKPTGR